MSTERPDSFKKLERVLEFVESELRTEMETLSAAIKRKDFRPGPTDLSMVRAPPSQRDRLQNLLAELTERDEFVALYLALTAIRPRVQKPEIEIGLTHPIDGVHERLIWPAVVEVIMGARSKITVVGYSIGSSPSVVFESLMDRSKDGIDLAFLVDRLEDKQDFLAWVKKLPYEPELYSRMKDRFDPKSSLHMKCIIADDDVAVVGSANPTYHGMMKNIEICLVIKDKDVVMRISRIVDRLKRDLTPHKA